MDIKGGRRGRPSDSTPFKADKQKFRPWTASFFKFRPHMLYFRIFQQWCSFKVWRRICYNFYFTSYKDGLILWWRLQFARLARLSPKQIFNSRAFGLTTEAWPWTASPAAPQFISACRLPQWNFTSRQNSPHHHSTLFITITFELKRTFRNSSLVWIREVTR